MSSTLEEINHVARSLFEKKDEVDANIYQINYLIDTLIGGINLINQS